MVNAAQYDHWVSVERNVSTAQSATGQPQEDWQSVARLWMRLSPIAGGESILANQRFASVTHRGSAPFVAGISPAMRLRLSDGRILQIAHIRNVDERGATMELLLTEAA